MPFSRSDPDDAAIKMWITGTLEERKWVLEIAWERYREWILLSLKGAFSNLAWQDCQDFAGDAFACLWTKLERAEFVWRGPNCLRSYLQWVAFNDARDYLRRRKLRAGVEIQIVAQEESRARDSGLDWVIRKEAETLKRSYFDMVIEKLIESSKRMKPAQRSVAAIMVDSLVTSGRWPSNERLVEILNLTEPDLKLSTVKERRKEVLIKFRPILDTSNLAPIW